MQNKNEIIEFAKEVISVEADALLKIKDRIGDDFVSACECLFSCKGRIVVTGMGKSSHIASKIAATLASTGSPAFFVHPAEAIHGDIGVVLAKDVVLAISNSGNTPEILAILPAIRHRGAPLISLTGNPESILAKEATINIDIGVEKEACPFGLAPTSSTTAALAMGDALAIALLKMRGFTAKDFALSHPGGALGKRLLLKIDDLMHAGDAMPQVQKGATLPQVLMEMTQKKLGMTTVVDNNGKLLGVFTDGDLRRALEKRIDIHDTKVETVMTKNPKVIASEVLAIDALNFMEQHSITALPIVNKQNIALGVVHLHDILKAGLK